MLRMTDNNNSSNAVGATVTSGENEFISIDQKKRQITFIEPSVVGVGTGAAATAAAGVVVPPTAGAIEGQNANEAVAGSSAVPLDRAPMVSAPKIFAFDGLFTNVDPQNDVCTAALQDVIPAVLDGIDGCVLALGHPKSGQSRTMFGSMASAGELGVIPCAISWLFKGIAEHREKGSRFSVRMSALAVSATKPGSKAHDLLATMASESDDSPGMYFNVGGPVELRASTVERAALYLDMALSQISNHAYAPATVFTLHVYQYNLEQGKLSGGRSRLHLISLGDAANAKGGLPLSGVGNVLLAVLSGQKHVPYKSHPLTVILRECLASFSSNISVITHLSYAQNRTDALTIIQLSSRIHRMRRKKNKYHPASRGGALQLNPTPGSNLGSSSSGLEPSSSEMSADTVIYLGPCHNTNEETDGEHPPVILPNLSYKGNQCTVDVPENYRKASAAVLPQQTEKRMVSTSRNVGVPVAAVQGTVVESQRQNTTRMNSHSAHNSPHHHNNHHQQQIHHSVSASSGNSSRQGGGGGGGMGAASSTTPWGMIHADSLVMEQWVDGPRVVATANRSKISEARHLKREVNRNKNSETWIDGPRMEQQQQQQQVGMMPVTPKKKVQRQQQPQLSTLSNPQLPSLSQKQRGYGFMDTHKKSMIRKWVENQTTEVLKISGDGGGGGADEWRGEDGGGGSVMVNNSGSGTKATPSPDEDDQDSGPSDIPPALPLIEKGSCGGASSKASEKDYGYTNNMNDYTAQTQVESECNDLLGAGHPLSALSYGNMSTVSSFHHHFEEVRIQSGDHQQRSVINDKNMDQLARIRELFTSQLALAEVNRVFHFCSTNDNNSIYSEPVHKLMDGGDLDSACSEPIFFNANSQGGQSRSNVIANQPQRPTEFGSKLEIALPSATATTTTTTASMTRIAATSTTYAAVLAGGEVSNLDDLDLEYPQAVAVATSSKNREFLFQEELARIIPHAQLQQQQQQQMQQPIVPESVYDSGHDSTPRTSKHSGFSRRAESGYHSISVTVHDESEVSSLKSTTVSTRNTNAARGKDRRLLCLWLRNPFNCTQPAETEAEISDF